MWRGHVSSGQCGVVMCHPGSVAWSCVIREVWRGHVSSGSVAWSCVIRKVWRGRGSQGKWHASLCRVLPQRDATAIPGIPVCYADVEPPLPIVPRVLTEVWPRVLMKVWSSLVHTLLRNRFLHQSHSPWKLVKFASRKINNSIQLIFIKMLPGH